ncbi:hypothetical protein KIN20_037401 [Parelaphostrongylus tenuis]|uniref:Uncharacterized protein n=1 Tax=Parelaphostrongylus tenuis TaxID=148309 RepID=A0AAD5REC7_PARTN|nr:hypothetical protein KIN20_037401 [Parelaphostrongylus tenuis]
MAHDVIESMPRMICDATETPRRRMTDCRNLPSAVEHSYNILRQQRTIEIQQRLAASWKGFQAKIVADLSGIVRPSPHFPMMARRIKDLSAETPEDDEKESWYKEVFHNYNARGSTTASSQERKDANSYSTAPSSSQMDNGKESRAAPFLAFVGHIISCLAVQDDAAAINNIKKAIFGVQNSFLVKNG